MVLRLLSFFSLSCLMMATCAQSAVVTYSLSGGTVSGTLNGVAFLNASYTVTADADPSNFVLGSTVGLPMISQPAVTTMTIAGFSPFQITVPNFGPLLVDTSTVFGPGTVFGGFAAQAGPDLDLLGLATLGLIPSFSGSVSVTGSLLGSANNTLTTTAGDLVITSFNGIATFTGEFPAVPEPTSMAIFGLGALGMATYRARRKTKA
jgi:hypothetical protein